MSIANLFYSIKIRISLRRKKKAEKKLSKELNCYFDKIINERMKIMSDINEERFKTEFIKFMQKFNK